jgi:dynein intermediate chain
MKKKLSNNPIELTEEESKIIQKSQEFAEFVDNSSKLVERALNEKYDFMKDYTLGIDIEK